MFCGVRRDGKCRPEHGVAVTERCLRAPDSGMEAAYQVVPADAALFGKLPLQFECKFFCD